MNVETNAYRRENRRGKVKWLVLTLLLLAFAGGFCFRLRICNAQNKQKLSECVTKQKCAEKARESKTEKKKQEHSNSHSEVAENNHSQGVWLKIVKHEHLLYVMNGSKSIARYGVAVGRNIGQKVKVGDCRTPEGKFSVQSIQSSQGWSHDFKDGKGVIPNAYGGWFIRLKTGWNGIGIHGTHDPSSIGKNVTEGCIRLKNENLQTLKDKYVRLGMVVVIEE